jgi:uncharacterized repeat protein (TIGR03803 family)
MKRHNQQGKTLGQTMCAATIALSLLTLLFVCAGAVPAQAQTPTTLYNFINGPSDAAGPMGNIVQGRDGNIYGVGPLGLRGANRTGAVYQITPTGAESVFVNFPATWINCVSGFTLGRDGNFYGACEHGNPTNNGSFLFRMTPAGVLTDIHDFASGVFAEYAPIQAADGNFYGVTSTMVYKMTTAGVVTTIHTFVSPDVQPLSNLYQASDGSLYGTILLCALSGNRGCVYKVSTAGVYKNVYGFADPTGSSPCTGMIQGKDGKLYGATDGGRPLNEGNIYKVTTAGVNTGLHDFNSVTDGGCNPGAGGFPVVSLLQVTDGNFYGTNYGGALANNGSIYKLTPANVFSVFLFPADNSDGNQPYTTLIQHTNGLVYGTSNGGGANSVGTFFSVATGDAPFLKLEPIETSGNVGASVGMFGQGFDGTSVVKFGGVAATSVTLTGTTYLTAVVPAGAHTGTVTVTTGATTLTSPQMYKVKPKILNFTPTSGHIAQLVTINGTGLIQATGVKFGTVKATTFTVVSDSQVTAVVPTVPLGAVTISISTPGGTANSPTKFTVN